MISFAIYNFATLIALYKVVPLIGINLSRLNLCLRDLQTYLSTSRVDLDRLDIAFYFTYTRIYNSLYSIQ